MCSRSWSREVGTSRCDRGSVLSVFNGANPNGMWNLFELDDATFDTGVISNGWILALTTANPVGAAADNLISMTATTGTVPTNGTGSYFLTVTNYGPSASSNVLVSDNLPFGVTFVSATPTLGSVTRAGASLGWNIGTLNTNAGAQLTVTVQPGSPGEKAGLCPGGVAEDVRVQPDDLLRLAGPQFHEAAPDPLLAEVGDAKFVRRLRAPQRADQHQRQPGVRGHRRDRSAARVRASPALASAKCACARRDRAAGRTSPDLRARDDRAGC